MSPQMYLVECVLPKEPRERKALVRRWVLIASSNQDAIYAAAIQAFTEVIGVEPSAKDIEGQLAQGVWSASMVGQGILSALAVSPGLFGVATASEPEVEPEMEPEPQPRNVPPPFPPRLEPPPLTPEQIKAQEKRARKAAKRAS